MPLSTRRMSLLVGFAVVVLGTAHPCFADQCHDAVQGRIAWDYQGHKSWVPANVDRLCRGASSDQPARCFARAMHGGVNWGGGTQWQWSNAIDLCSGTSDSQATIACFQQRIAEGQKWQAAIASCKAGTPGALDNPVCPDTGQRGPQRTVMADGTVEVRLPDGDRVLTRPGECGSKRIKPDGQTQQFVCNQVQPATMPEAPGPGARHWLEAHNESLMGIILVLLDSASVNNYVSSVERDHPDLYDQIKLRTALIGQLTSSN